MAIITRRTVLTGAAATAAAAMHPGGPASTAHAAEALPPVQQMAKFVKISVGLTGIPTNLLGPNADPTNVKAEYLKKATENSDLSGRWSELEKIFDQQFAAKRNPNDPNNLNVIDDKMLSQAIAHHSDPRIRFYARSIILMWYLGAWYDPNKLQQDADAPAQPVFPPTPQIISPNAYKQAWVWRAAQAHPMGYSEMQFGYWANKPGPRSNFIGS